MGKEKGFVIRIVTFVNYEGIIIMDIREIRLEFTGLSRIL